MSTRSRIGLQAADGTITSVYCHSDGYLEGVGSTLAQHYTDKTKVEALLALGDLSSLGTEIGEKHPFDSMAEEHKHMTFAYGRDRGESDVDATKSHDLAAFRQAADGSEFTYLFVNGAWTYCEGHAGKFKPIKLTPRKKRAK